MGLYIVKIYPCFGYSSIAVTAQLNLEKFYCLGYGVRVHGGREKHGSRNI